MVTLRNCIKIMQISWHGPRVLYTFISFQAIFFFVSIQFIYVSYEFMKLFMPKLIYPIETRSNHFSRQVLELNLSSKITCWLHPEEERHVG
jgi:hypothetical protein